VSLEAVEKTIRDAKAASEARVMSPEEPLVALSAKTAAIANASDGPRGLLAQFPPRVLRMAFGEVSAAGDFEQLRQLLVGSFGQYIDAPCERDGSRRTPLHWAVHGGHVDCVRLLLRHGADASVTAEDGWTALHAAAAGGTERHAACARLLLRYGCSSLQPDLRGNSSLDLARVAATRGERAVFGLLEPLAVAPNSRSGNELPSDYIRSLLAPPARDLVAAAAGRRPAARPAAGPAARPTVDTVKVSVPQVSVRPRRVTVAVGRARRA